MTLSNCLDINKVSNGNRLGAANILVKKKKKRKKKNKL